MSGSPDFFDRDQALRAEMGANRMAEPKDESAFWEHQRSLKCGPIEDPSINPPRRYWLLAIPAVGLVLIVLAMGVMS